MNRSAVHWSFWAIAALTLLWNLATAVNYFVQLNPGMLESYSAAARATVEGRPAWATAGFALAAFAGVAGSVLLLRRKSLATSFFIASLVGVVVTAAHTLQVARADSAFGAPEIVLYLLMPLGAAVFFVGFARRAERKLWLD